MRFDAIDGDDESDRLYFKTCSIRLSTTSKSATTLDMARTQKG